MFLNKSQLLLLAADFGRLLNVLNTLKLSVTNNAMANGSNLYILYKQIYIYIYIYILDCARGLRPRKITNVFIQKAMFERSTFGIDF